MKRWYIMSLLISTFVGGLNVAPAVESNEKQEEDNGYISREQLVQDKEYMRYLIKVIKVMEADPAYIKRSETMSYEDATVGKLTDGLMPLLSDKVREKLNQLKKDEVEQQRLLAEENRTHMAGIGRNEWNTIHLDDKDKERFTQDDLTNMLNRLNNVTRRVDEARRKKFKEHEMSKELERREEMENKTEEVRAELNRKYKLHHEKKHEKMHEPGRKAQMEEVWEKGDGLDKEAFNVKTFFNLHDKNSDGYLDKFELETVFLPDLDKVYNETDPDTDPKEREEEMERMREDAMEKLDVDNDGLISQREFLKETQDDEFNKDKEWTPLTESEQFTEDELEDFRSQLDKSGEEDV